MTEIDPQNMYDEEYFMTNKKSNYSKEYWDYDARKVEIMRDCIGFISSFNPKPTVLEAGCGLGLLVRAFRELNVNAFGCDISEWAINNSYSSIKEYLKVADISEKIPYEDNKFNLILCIDVIEHIPEDRLDNTVKELYRVCNGFVFFVIPTRMFKEDGAQTDLSHISILPIYKWLEYFLKDEFFRVMEVFPLPVDGGYKIVLKVRK
jgi:2-polyprenyl-3-methyl-5-hydroxy-6-metoxy-1,4-benzoquinol methylase